MAKTDSVSSAASNLTMALMKKMKLVLLSFKLCKWRFPKGIIRINVGTRRSRSFNGGGGGRRGLCGCLEDVVEASSSMTIRRLQRTRSCVYAYSKYDDQTDDGDDDDYDDVDRRAEIFIANFRSRLLMEREVSLKLRYCEKV